MVRKEIKFSASVEKDTFQIIKNIQKVCYEMEATSSSNVITVEADAQSNEAKPSCLATKTRIIRGESWKHYFGLVCCVVTNSLAKL